MTMQERVEMQIQSINYSLELDENILGGEIKNLKRFLEDNPTNYEIGKWIRDNSRYISEITNDIFELTKTKKHLEWILKGE